MLTPIVAYLGWLAATGGGADLTVVYAAVITAVGAVGGALLLAGPRRKQLLAEAHQVALQTVLEANADLEERLQRRELEFTELRRQLGFADKRIAELEKKVRALKEENAVERVKYQTRLAGAREQREILAQEVDRLRHEVKELRLQREGPST